MTDIVERLRGGWNHDRNPEADMAEAADCIAKLEQQLIEWKELTRNIDAQLRTELAAEIKNKQEFERDWLACCDKLNDERRIHLELEETLVKKLEATQAREKVLHSLSNELLHQIDINDFTDSHGHSAKMLKAVHDLMKYNTQPTDDTTLNNLLAEGQSREKVLRDALDYLAHNLGEYACAMQTQQQADVLTNYSIAAFAALAMPTDDTTLRAALKAERERCLAECEKIHARGFRETAFECIEAIRALEDE